jgi:hypothetical protein
MFCIHCGKQNVDNAMFCAFCGKAIKETQIQSTTTKWEYFFIRKTWKSGNGGRYNLLNGKTEYSVRLDLWGQDQSEVMKQMQEFYDLGWQSISPPGPGSYRFAENTAYSNDYKYTWLEVRSFIVELRRPAQERTEKEKEIIGIWQETQDPNDGFWNKLGNVIFMQKLEVERAKIEFRDDKTFTLINRGGKEVDSGIFVEDDGKITMIYKYSPELDTTATVEGDSMSYKNQQGNIIRLERVKK